jgi:hypothetical protein
MLPKSVDRLRFKLRFSGTDGIIKKIRDTVGNGPVYLSIDVSPHPLGIGLSDIKLISG